MTLNFIGDSFNYLDSSGQSIPDFADMTLPVQQGTGSTLYVDVPFGTSQTLNASSIGSDAFSVTAITSGTTTTATGSVTVSLASTTAVSQGMYQFDLTGGSLAAGDDVTIQFNAGNWTYGVGDVASVVQAAQNLTIAPGQSRSYLDVSYPLINGSPINPATITGDEFALSGRALRE